MKRMIIGLAIVLLPSLACQHPSLDQAADQPVSQAVVTTLPLSVYLGR
jgi:hypothetical protein